NRKVLTLQQAWTSFNHLTESEVSYGFIAQLAGCSVAEVRQYFTGKRRSRNATQPPSPASTLSSPPEFTSESEFNDLSKALTLSATNKTRNTKNPKKGSRKANVRPLSAITGESSIGSQNDSLVKDELTYDDAEPGQQRKSKKQRTRKKTSESSDFVYTDEIKKSRNKRKELPSNGGEDQKKHFKRKRSDLPPIFVREINEMTNSIEITFLGTSSSQPTPDRNTSSLALTIDGTSWLFDVGEATQHQILKVSNIKWGKIDRIFITHLHGDHIFGLSPLLCTATNNLTTTSSGTARHPIEIYGPSGLRKFLRQTLKLTRSFLGRDYMVHELLFPEDPVDQPDEKELYDFEQLGKNIQLQRSGDNLYWEVIDGKSYKITAAPIKHSIPCLGYVFSENSLPGKIDAQVIKPILLRNKEALGIKNPMELMKKLQNGETLHLPDGTIIEPPPRRPGRKIVLLGDTYDPSGIIHLAMNADVLVHEATNSLTSSDPPGTSYESVEEGAIRRGHSTARMAGKFAAQINAHKLILNHFSSRYRGCDSKIIEEIRMAAVEAFGNDRVICAEDRMLVQIKEFISNRTNARPILNTFANNIFGPNLFTQHIRKKSTKISTPFDAPPSVMYSPAFPTARPAEGDRSSTAGRTVNVSGSAAMGYRRLWSILNANKIRQEVRRGRYYEKPTIRRKRIRREISEARFKEAIKKKVNTVLQMKARLVNGDNDIYKIIKKTIKLIYRLTPKPNQNEEDRTPINLTVF
ncbi:2515_t:CDS:10, partial [Acaulospora morrowiae]